MSDQKIRILFNASELAALGRCAGCGWHPPTQGHHPDCPHPKAQKGKTDETVPKAPEARPSRRRAR